MHYANTPCQAGSLFPSDTRELFANAHPDFLDRLEQGDALPKIHALLEARQDRRHRFLEFTWRVYDVYECALNLGWPVWDVAWSMTELHARQAAENAAMMKDRAAVTDPAAADLLNNYFKVSTEVAEVARRKQQEIDEILQQWRADYPPTPRQKTTRDRRVYFARGLRGWFSRYLGDPPPYELIANLAKVAFPSDDPNDDFSGEAVRKAYSRDGQLG
jgi:hypothetical protein